MSAFVVDREHVAYLIDATTARELETCQGVSFQWFHAGRWHSLTGYTDDDPKRARIGAMLWRENVRSVDTRYAHNEDARASAAGADPYVYGEHRPCRLRVKITPAQVIQAVACLDYQSCQTDDWQETEAYAFLQALRNRAIARMLAEREAESGRPLIWGIDQCSVDRARTERPPVRLVR